MGAIGIIAHFSKLKDVSWERTDGSPVQQDDVPRYEASASKLFMGPAGSGGAGGTGSFSMGVSTLGNTLGLTGVTGTRVVLAGVGGVTLSQSRDGNGATISVSAPPQSAQTQNRFNLTLAGNTDGALQEVSSGTLTLAGGANITLSQNGNAVSIIGGAGGGGTQTFVGGVAASDATYTSGTVEIVGSGDITVRSSAGQRVVISGSQSVQPETQTFVGGVANSQTTYTSGTVRLSELGAVTIRSTTGQQLQISVAPQSVQPETQTFVGGVAGSNTTYTSGTVNIVGSGNVVVQSGTGQRLIISGSQSVQPETKTFVGGIVASDTTYTSGSIRFTGVGGGVTVSSNTGQRIDISVAAPVAQTVQTQDRFDLTISGNTAGAGALVSSGTLTLAGGNNITVSQAGNAITISGANVGGAQTGISGFANSETTYSSGTVKLSELGAITIRSTTGQQFQLSVNSQSNQSEGWYALGNTTGQSSSTTRDARSISIEGAGIVSVGYSGGSLRISATQSVQPETQTFVAGVANSETTYSSGTVKLSELGAVTIRSTTGQQLQISVAPQSVQPETQTFLGGLAASDTTYTSGTVRITGVGGGVTVSSNTGQRIDISVAAPVAQTGTQFSAGISGGNTAGDTGTVPGRVVFAGGQSITLSGSTNGASETISIVGASTSQSAQTQDRFNLTLSGNTSGALAQVSSGTLTLAGGNNITLSQAGNAITISGANVGGAQTGISGIANSQTTYTSGTVSLSELGAITIRSTTGNQFQLSVAAQTAESQSIGMSNLGNTSGTTGIASGAQVRYLLAGGNNITLSQSLNGASGTLTISGPTVSQSIGMSNVGNTSGTTGVASGSQVRFVFAGGNNITLSQSLNGASGTITISGANIGGAQTGISGLANSETTYTSGTVKLSELGAVTIRSTTGQQLQISVNSQTNQTEGWYALGNTTGQSSSTTRDARSISVEGAGIISVGYSGGSLRISASQSVQPETQTFLGGVAASDATYTSGTVQITGSNLVTVRSSAGQRVVIDASVPAQTDQTVGLYALGNTVGESSSTTRDARSLSLRGDGIVSVGYSNGSIRISASQSIQAETQTFIGGVANSETTYTSGTVKLSELGALTIRSTTGNQLQLSVNPQTGTQFSAGLSNIGNTSGDTGTKPGQVVLAGGNNVTLSGSTNGDSMTITISGPNVAGAQTGISGFANSETTYTSGTVKLSELGAITIRSTTGQQLQLSVNAQSDQTLGMYALGNTMGQSSSTTRDARSLSVEGAGIVSVGYSAGSLRISATQSVQAETQTFIGGISASDTLYTSGTVRITGVGGGITVSSNTGQRIDLSVAAPNPAFSAGISGGNTSGQTGITGTRLALAGGNNVTLSGATDANGGTVTISAASQSAESQSFGMSNLGNTSGTTGIASGAQVRALLAGGNNITLSQSLNGASATITISAPNQSAESQSIGMSNLGNTSGTTGIASGAQVRMLFAGGNNITLSQSVNGASGTITISGGAGGAFSAGVSSVGNSSGDTGITGSRLVLAGGNNVTLSQSTNASGGTVTVSAPNASVLSAVAPLSTSTNGSTISILAPAQFSGGFSTAGNTSGDTGFVTGRLALVGGNGITLSGSTNAGSQTITISGLTTAAQSAQTLGMYAVQNTTGQSSSTTMDARTLSVAGDGAVSVGYSAGSLRISAPVQTGTQFSGGLTNAGNTAGDTGVVAGRLVLVGSNNITLSGSTNGASETVSIIGGAGGAFSAGVSNVGNTSGDTGITGSRLVLSGGQSITLSQSTNASGATVMISGPSTSQSVQTLGMYAVQNTTGQSSSTTMDARTLSVAGDGAVSVGYSGGSLRISAPTQTVESQSIGMSNIGNTSGTTGIATGAQVRFLLAGGNNITLSQSLNGASGTITISAPTQTVESQSIGMSNVGNTSGTTGMASGGQVRFVFAGGNNITLSQSLNGASGTITISAPNLGAGAMSAGASNLGNTAGSTGVTGTRLVFVGTNAITLSQSTDANGGTLSVAAPATSSLVGTSGVSISTNGSTISVYNTLSQSFGMSNIGNTSGTTGMASADQVRFVLAGGANITLSQSLNGSSGTITISGGAGGGFSAGVSNLGNTAGSTGATGTRLVLVGSNNVTLSQSTDANGGTVTINAGGGGGFSAGISGGNTSGQTGVTGTRLVFAGGNSITLSGATDANGGSITVSAPNASSLTGASGISISTGGSTISVLPMANTSFNPFQQVMAVTGQQGQGTLHIQPLQIPHLQFDRILLSHQFSNASNSSGSFTLSNWVGIYTRNASTLSLLSSISTSTNFSGSGTVGSYSLFGGMRQLSIPWTMTLSSGDYYFGIVSRSTTAGAAGQTLNQLLKSHFTSATLTGWSGLVGAATNATVQQQLGLGTYSVTTAGIPNSIGFSEITGTGSLPLFVPLFHLRSGTV